MKPSLTIGIEEEYQTIDPETRDLRSHVESEILSKGKTLLKEAVKAEMHQSVVEIGTGVCPDIVRGHQSVEGASLPNMRVGFAKWTEPGGGRYSSIR